MCGNDNKKDYLGVRRVANGFLVENGNRMEVGNTELFSFENFYNLCEHIRFSLRADELMNLRMHHQDMGAWQEGQRDELGEKRRECERLTKQLEDANGRLAKTVDNLNTVTKARDGWFGEYEKEQVKVRELQAQIDKLKSRKRKRSKK